MGKGSKVRDGLDTEEYGKKLENIASFIHRCGSCDGFRGVKPTGHAICEKDVNFDINNAKAKDHFTNRRTIRCAEQV